MGHFTRADIPFYYALADAFTICDAFFCSIQGPTNVNRMHLFTGTSGLSVGSSGSWNVNNVDDGNWTANASLDDLSFPAYTWTTYAERLQAAGVTWRVYQEYDNYGDNSLAFFANFRGIDTASPLYRHGRGIVPGSTASDAYTSTGEYLIAEFERDVQQGTLPQVSWIVAPYLMSEHPEASPAYGESLSARLLAALGEDVVLSDPALCCGSLARYGGDAVEARAREVALTDAARRWSDAVIVGTATGCQSRLADASGAAGVACDELHAHLADHPALMSLRFAPLAARVAVHRPCSQRLLGTRSSASVDRMLALIPGVTRVELPEQDRCCGAAGSHFIARPAQASALLDRVLGDIASATPDMVVSTNIGCRLLLEGGLGRASPRIPVVHPVELLARQLLP
jgi:hypothetical protein